MELKRFTEKIKSEKIKTHLIDLIYEILKLEECLIENANPTKDIEQLGEVLFQCFSHLIEHKLEINNPENPHLDLDRWKNEIKKYKFTNKIEKETYLYVMRNSIKNLIPVIQQKDELSIKIYLFELIIKTFLYIDYLNLSIDTILEIKMKSIKGKVSEKEKKEVEEK